MSDIVRSRSELYPAGHGTNDRGATDTGSGERCGGVLAGDRLVTQGHLQAGEWLLVTGVSSGVGVAALQAAKAMGAKVIGTSGSAEKLERLKALGLDVGLCTRAPDFNAAVMEATGSKGVNLAINTVGGSVHELTS